MTANPSHIQLLQDPGKRIREKEKIREDWGIRFLKRQMHVSRNMISMSIYDLEPHGHE